MGKNPKSATERFVPRGEDKLARMSVQLRRVNGVSSVPVVASAPAAPMAQRGSGCRAGALAAPSLPSRWAQLGSCSRSLSLLPCRGRVFSFSIPSSV